MRFWETSALLSFIAGQSHESEFKSLLAFDSAIALWWGTRIELASGFCRLQREGRFDGTMLADLMNHSEKLLRDADEIEPTELVRIAATRLLRVHPLRAADSLQLGAALVWTEQRPARVGFVCLDQRLREAAMREGFDVLPK